MSDIYYLRGKLNWAKILGDPRPNTFDPDNREWTVDVLLDDEGEKLVHKLGLKAKVKETDNGQPFLKFKQREFRVDGGKNDPIRVEDKNGKPWDQDEKIGNGTVADVKFTVKDYGKGKPKGVYIRAIRILDLVQYKPVEFAPLSSDDEYFIDPPCDTELSSDTPDFESDFGLIDDEVDDIV